MCDLASYMSFANSPSDSHSDDMHMQLLHAHSHMQHLHVLAQARPTMFCIRLVMWFCPEAINGRSVMSARSQDRLDRETDLYYIGHVFSSERLEVEIQH